MPSIESTLRTQFALAMVGVFFFGTGCPSVPAGGYYHVIVPCDASTPCPATTEDAGALECVTIDDPEVRGICARPCASMAWVGGYHACIGWTGTQFADGAPGYWMPLALPGASSNQFTKPVYAYDLPSGGALLVMMPNAPFP